MLEADFKIVDLTSRVGDFPLFESHLSDRNMLIAPTKDVELKNAASD